MEDALIIRVSAAKFLHSMSSIRSGVPPLAVSSFLLNVKRALVLFFQMSSSVREAAIPRRGEVNSFLLC